MGRLRHTLVLCALLALCGPAARAAEPSARLTGPDGAQIRSLVRAGVHTHRRLRRAATHVTLAPGVLAPERAANKRYGDSWTCRESSRRLIAELAQQHHLVLDSSGKNTFHWGNEGLVSFHYYAVDNQRHPSLLLDPTAAANFARDARPGKLLHGLLEAVGHERNQPDAARRIARRVASGGINGLLVLTRPGDISIYREALERAAALATEANLRRDAARQPGPQHAQPPRRLNLEALWR